MPRICVVFPVDKPIQKLLRFSKIKISSLPEKIFAIRNIFNCTYCKINQTTQIKKNKHCKHNI